MTSKVSGRHGLTASAIRKLRNAQKAQHKARVSAMNEANADVVKARQEPDSISRLVTSEMKSKRANNNLSSSASRERLKGGSYGVGFQGPRGFASPTYKVGKQEADGGKLAPGRHLAITGPASSRFATDGYRIDKAEGEGSVQRLSKPFKKAGKKGLERQWMTVDLNESAKPANDAALDRMTDAAQSRIRRKAIGL